MAALTIITQNLNQYQGKGDTLKSLEDIKKRYKKADVDVDDVDIYTLLALEVIKKKYKDVGVDDVDIYAFQELRKEGTQSFSTNTIVKKRFCKDTRVSGCSAKEKEIWDKAFPWSEFLSGYWDECDIKYAGKRIKIINVHCSPRWEYMYAIRYTLLKRLSEIQENGLTILLGDFNAAFRNQTEVKKEAILTDNEKFLNEITEKYGFIECTSTEEEAGKLQYTYYLKKKKNGQEEKEGKKVDHIFLSKSLFNLLKKYKPDKEKPYVINYIDEVNRDFSSQPSKAFTDHSGIMLTIELPDKKEDAGSEQTEKLTP